MKIGEDDAVDMRPNNTEILGHGDQHYRLLKRLKKLEQLGLAWEIEPGRWNLSAGIDDTLKELVASAAISSKPCIAPWPSNAPGTRNGATMRSIDPMTKTRW